MPKLINKMIEKGKKKEDLTILPLLDASRSEETLVFLPPDDTIIGMFELSTNECEKNVDVVAVHGFQGDAYKTWEHDNGSLWLRAFLPADIPNARIMTFGYNSAATFSKSVPKIENKALQLLNHFSTKRSPGATGSPSKPIIFICHGLRGIVIKKALVLAHEGNLNVCYRDILVNTRGIACLGMPHRGSDIALWADFAGQQPNNAIIDIFTNLALISDLKKVSATLTDISSQFAQFDYLYILRD